MREPKWGELQSKDNFEAYLIWNTRHDEPEPVAIEVEPQPQFLDDPADSVDAKQACDLLQCRMKRRDFYVLYCYHVMGMPFSEIGRTLDLSVERIRQIHSKAMRMAVLALSPDWD